MTKPTLYYTLFSPPSRACILTAKLINLDLELKPIDFTKQENHTDWYLKLNPRHTVPVLVDELVPICDSHAILSYMISKYAPNDNLYPKDLVKRAKVDELLYYENGVLSQCIKDFVGRILYGNESDYSKKSFELCNTAYGFLEQYLQSCDYVAGNQMTIADVSINTTLITLNKIVPVDAAKYLNPNKWKKGNSNWYRKVNSWIDRMKAVPAYDDINEKGAYQLYARIITALSKNRLQMVESHKQIE